jgi:ABC-type Mn2+/Zn2+ transport system ATPase subunit
VRGSSLITTNPTDPAALLSDHVDDLRKYTDAPPVTSWTRVFTASYIPLLGEHVTEARSGAGMHSGHAIETFAAVLAAGVGVRRGAGWELRSASFRLEPSGPGSSALGIVTSRQAATTALIEVLAGQIPPAYGILHVLGQDMATARGRLAVRRRVGLARLDAWPRPGIRVRGLVEHAARLACQPGHDRHLLVAAILDRLSLTPWSDVPLRSAPDQVIGRARIAAATVHQPDLLLIDGLLNDLPETERAMLTGVIGDLARDTSVIVIGRDADALTQACPEALVLADGILIGSPPLTLTPPATLTRSTTPPWPPHPPDHRVDSRIHSAKS